MRNREPQRCESPSKGDEPARRGREHLVDFGRSEEMYLVIRDQYLRSFVFNTHKPRASSAGFCIPCFYVRICTSTHV
jgi:hypothetical protein